MGACQKCEVVPDPAGQTESERLYRVVGRLRDECLNEHWFVSLAHATVEIEAWRREYNEERPKKSLGGLTPSAYAQRLAGKSVTLSTASKALRCWKQGDVGRILSLCMEEALRDRPTFGIRAARCTGG